MYDKDAPEEGSTDREELERLNQSRKQQGEDLDQPAVPGSQKNA
jgi:hypothetical protein